MNWSYRENNKNTLCMIMAGGQGSRLQPLTRDRAKPAVHFGGTYRIIDFVLNNFINSGIFKIKVLTQFKSDSLNKHISAAWNLNASLDQYVDLVPAQMRTGSEWYRGTADAIFQNINLITDERPDIVAIFGGDHIYKMDVNQMIDFHLSRAALLTIAAIPVPVEEASEFGIIEVDQDNRMIGFEEKPKQAKQMPGRPGWCLASMGNYVFTSKFLVRELLKHSSNGATDFGKDIIPALYPNYPVYVYDFNTNIVRGERAETKGYWRTWELLTHSLKQTWIFAQRIRLSTCTTITGQSAHLIGTNHQPVSSARAIPNIRERLSIPSFPQAASSVADALSKAYFPQQFPSKKTPLSKNPFSFPM
ncbi:nucleotidyltransferase-like protein [Fibrobacter sp. UWS1]|nr:sugar phosphate nucleotidyltransferase [Fibrobacter sp. UWS1]PBC66658.1 nucleotidyltransferase-like protein [Fibrobacter sp. UWS1]